MILGNICNCLYLILIINSINLLSLIIAEFLCSLAFALKDISEPAILNESIDATKSEKSKIFAKIQSKAVSEYYALSAFSMAISGFLFEINGYIPMYISLGIVFITLLISTRFDSPYKSDNNTTKEDSEISLKEAIKFSFESKRCRCLLLFSAIFSSILTVLSTYEVSLLDDLNVSSKFIGVIFAVLNIVSGIASVNQSAFQEKFKNRTMTFLGLALTISCAISGLIAKINLFLPITITVILIMYIVKYSMIGLYNVLLIKYLSNFTNNQIDTKIFAINSFCSSVLGAIFGIFASVLIKYMTTANAMIVFGMSTLVLMIIVLLYMKNKVGLDPANYSEIELKYDTKV